MRTYTFKTYITGGKEYYVVTDSQGRIVETKSVPFPESLVSLLYKNFIGLDSWLHGISSDIDWVTPVNAHDSMKEISEQYDRLAESFAYFESWLSL